MRTVITLFTFAALAVLVVIYAAGHAQTEVRQNHIIVPIEMADTTEEKILWAVEPYLDPNEVTKKTIWEEIHPVGEEESVQKELVLKRVKFSLFSQAPSHSGLFWKKKC